MIRWWDFYVLGEIIVCNTEVCGIYVEYMNVIVVGVVHRLRDEV